MEKAVLLQKQIRDNAQDLHSYMSDLSSWEKDMKRKESELTGEPIEQVVKLYHIFITEKYFYKKADGSLHKCIFRIIIYAEKLTFEPSLVRES